MKFCLILLCLFYGLSLRAQDPQVKLDCVIYQVSPKLAAEWGIDGGPAAKPELSPLKKDIPAIMNKEEYRKVFNALRQNKDSHIKASSSLIIHSGIEGYNLKGADENDDNTEGQQEMDEGCLSFGEIRDEIGLNFRFTPTVQPDGVFVQIELGVKHVERIPLKDNKAKKYNVLEFLTTLTLKDKYAAIFFMAKSSEVSSKELIAKDPKANYPHVMFIYVEIVEP